MPDPIAQCWACQRHHSIAWPAPTDPWRQVPPYVVRCLNPMCTMIGPKRSTPADAIAAWNAVAALYRWTDTREETPV